MASRTAAEKWLAELTDLPTASGLEHAVIGWVRSWAGEAQPMMEEISLDDFHGLVDLLLLAAAAVDGVSDLPQRLNAKYAETRHPLT